MTEIPEKCELVPKYLFVVPTQNEILKISDSDARGVCPEDNKK